MEDMEWSLSQRVFSCVGYDSAKASKFPVSYVSDKEGSNELSEFPKSRGENLYNHCRIDYLSTGHGGMGL